MTDTQESQVRNEPEIKRVAVYIEADEFFHLQKKIFHDNYLSFDAATLAKEIIATNPEWELVSLIVYVPIPTKTMNSEWNRIWGAMSKFWRHNGCTVYNAEQDMSYKVIYDPSGVNRMGKVFDKTNCRLNMVMEIVQTCMADLADVIVVVTGDRMLSPLSHRIRQISHLTQRWIKLVSAAPYADLENGERGPFCGIPNSDWLHITREMYEKCLKTEDPTPTEAEE